MVVRDLEAIVRGYLREKPFGELRGIVLRTHTALKDLHSNKRRYDVNSLIIYFQQTGFAEIREMRFYESRIPGIQDIEQASRVLKGEGTCIERPNRRSCLGRVSGGRQPLFRKRLHNVRYSVELVRALIRLGSHPCRG
jgi:hypothetical protein